MQAVKKRRWSFAKSGELHIIRDEHVDPTSGSQFAIVEEDFLERFRKFAIYLRWGIANK